jgi:hypothetical protein
LLAPQRDVIVAQDTWTALGIGVGKRMQDPHERVWADRNTGLAREASATLAAGLQCERGE